MRKFMRLLLAMVALLLAAGSWAEAAEEGGAAAAGAALVEKDCLGCHLVEKLSRYRKSEEQWARTITNMINAGVAQLTEAEQKLLSGYMANNYGAKRKQ